MLSLASLTTSAVGKSGGTFTLGAMKLDNMTFDKIINVPEFKFLVKIGDALSDFSRGFTANLEEHHEEWSVLCDMVYGAKNFIAAEIPVDPPISSRNYENHDIFERFSLGKDEFPAFYLYTEENKQPQNGPNGIRYRGVVDANLMAAWLRTHNVPVPMPGTIAELDQLAKKFMKDFSDSHIAEAKKLAETKLGSNSKAMMYLKIMEKVKAKGKAYIAVEIKRVTKMSKGQQGEENQAKLREKLLVLKVFAESAGKERVAAEAAAKTAKEKRVAADAAAEKASKENTDAQAAAKKAAEEERVAAAAARKAAEEEL